MQRCIIGPNREEAGLLSVNEFEYKNPSIFAFIKDDINALNSTKVYLKLTDKLLRKLDNNQVKRYQAVELLQHLKSADTKVHLALAKVLQDEEELIRFTALQALKQVKSTDPTLALALVRALEEPNLNMRIRVLESI